LVIIAIGYFSLAFACVAACNDQAFLALLTVIMGLVLITLAIIGAVKWIQYLDRRTDNYEE